MTGPYGDQGGLFVYPDLDPDGRWRRRGDHHDLHVYTKLDLEHGDGNYVQPPDLLCFLQRWCGKVGKVEASDGGDHGGLFVHPEPNLEHDGGSHVGKE
jgi:hypothetical protein